MDKVKESFLDYLRDLEDPRSTRNRLHSMPEILLVTLCAAICNAERWQEVESYGKTKIEHLRKYLPYKNGIPSDDTLRRFFRAIDPNQLQELLQSWIKSLHRGENNTTAIDDKSSKHSYDDAGNVLHMISAYATEARTVLNQEKVLEESNEIIAIPN